MRSLLILIVAVAGGLATTNPSRTEYLDWVQHQNADETSSLLFGIVRPLVDASTKAENFTLFTVFSTKVDATHGGRVLGLMHRFYALPSLSGETWKPGTKSSSFPHVIAAQATNEWLPEAGYRWINEPPTRGDFRVRWVPGSTTTAFPHVKAGASEGQWFPEDGYVWVVAPPKPGDLRVRWSSGKRSTEHPHVVAASQEGRWLPESRFVWVNNPPAPGDFRVKVQAGKGETGLPRLQGKILPACQDEKRSGQSPACWFDGNTGIHVATKAWARSAATFAHWPDVDMEVAEVATVTQNQAKAGCSISEGQLFCPGPGTGLCWARGHDPYRDEPPMSIDVGNEGSQDFGHSERCSGAQTNGENSERALLFETR